MDEIFNPNDVYEVVTYKKYERMVALRTSNFKEAMEKVHAIHGTGVRVSLFKITKQDIRYYSKSTSDSSF